MLESTGFTYNGISSSVYNIINCKISSGLFEEPFISSTEIFETVVRGREVPYFQGSKRNPLTFKLVFAIDPSWTTDIIRGIARWLWVDGYKPLIFDDFPNQIYFTQAVGDSNLFHNGVQSGYIELTMRCSSPYAYQPQLDKYYNTLSATPTFTRPSPAYQINGTSVLANIPRYENGYFQNLLTDNQASVETDLIGFATGGRTSPTILSRDTSTYWQGTASLKVICDGTVASQGFYTTAAKTFKTGSHTSQLRIKGSGTVTVRLTAADLLITAPDQTITLNSNWQQVINTTNFTGISVDVEIQVFTTSPQATTFYVDGLQIEEGSVAKDWTLPSLGKGIMIEEGTINIVIPNLKSATTGLSSDSTGAVISLSTEQTYYGTNSIKYVGGTGLSNIYLNTSTNFTQTSSTAFTATYAVRRLDGGVVNITQGRIYVSGNTENLQPAVTTPLGNGWYKVAVSITGLISGGVYLIGIYFPDLSTYYIDGWQVEAKAYSTSFAGYNTTRSPETPTIPATGVLSPTQGTVEFVYIPNLSSTVNTDFNLFTWGLPGARGFLLRHLNSSTPLLAQSYSPTATDINYLTSYSAGDKLRIGFSWTASQCKFYVNGSLVGTANIGFVAPTETIAQIGYREGYSQANGIIDDLCISSIARTDADMLTRGTSTSPLVPDDYTTWKMNFDANLYPSINIPNNGDLNLKPEIEITKIGAGDVELVNTTNGNQSFKFTSLADQEVVYVNCENEEIISNLSSTYRYSNFGTSTFIELLRGNNLITVNGKCNIHARLQPKVLQG